MAREWALRGVDEEELRPEPKPEPPKTPKGKWENYWYHYKWHTVIGVAAAVVLGVLIKSIVTRDPPDYQVILGTQGSASQEAVDKLQSVLEQYGADVDGDGKVEVQIDALYFAANDPQMLSANATKLMANLSMSDVMLYIFDEDTYRDRIVAQETDGYRFFTPLDGVEIPAGGQLSSDGYYWNWKGSGLQKDAAMKSLPEDLLFGVRSVSGTTGNEKGQKNHDQAMALLKAFLKQKPQAAAVSETADASAP